MVPLYVYTSLAFNAVTIPFYAIFVLTLFKEQFKPTSDLNGPFFKLMISLGVADVTAMINNMIYLRLPRFSSQPLAHATMRSIDNVIGAKMIVIIYILMLTSQVNHLIAISINRVTAITRSFQHNQIWSGRTLKAVVGACWLLAFAWVGPLFTKEFGMRRINATGTYHYSFERNEDAANYVSAAATAILLYGSALIGCYVVIVVKFLLGAVKKNTQVGPNAGTSIVAWAQNAAAAKRSRRRALKMAGVGLTLASLYFASVGIEIVGQVVWLVYHQNCCFGDAQNYFMLKLLFQDLFSGVNPYLMMLISSLIRNKFKELFLGLISICKKVVVSD